MNRRFFPVLTLCFFAYGLCSFCLTCSGEETSRDLQRPNILFIMSDDHAAEAVGVYQRHLASLNPTPNLDALARNGMVFRNAFCTNSICVPSRATILTGQHSQTNGVLGLDDPLPAERQYLPIEMKKLGYQTAIIGKYHLKNEPSVFDYYKVLPVQGKYFDPDFRVKGEGQWPNNIVKSKGHSSDVITDLTIDYLKHKRDRSKPFMLLHHYKAPHGPFRSAPRYADYLENTPVPTPESLFSKLDFGDAQAKTANEGEGEDGGESGLNNLHRLLGTSISDRHVFGGSPLPWDGNLKTHQQATHAAYQKHLKQYLRCVKGVDDNLGRLFDYLKQEGLWDNTVIIYTSDQGMMLGAHDLTDKRWMFEESMRMPLIVHFPPLIQPRSTCDLLINNTDFAPTMLAIAGGKTPTYMQGESFLETLQGKEQPGWRTATYYRYWRHLVGHFVPAHFGIRTQNYKLIFYYGAFHRPEKDFARFYWGKRYGKFASIQTPPVWQLFDLKKDPHELVNRYGDADYAQVVGELKTQLKKLRVELNETDQTHPKLKAIIDQHWD